MSAEEYLEEMNKIQKNLLDYLDYEDNIEEKYQNLKNIFDDIKIHDNQYKVKSLLYLIKNISRYHHRGSNFFSKIEQILNLFKDDMKQYFTNSDLFKIFKRNKRLLLFLIEEKIMIMDKSIVMSITKSKYINENYPQYFQPEIQPFINEKWFQKYENNEDNKWVEEIKKELPDDFYEKRRIGENDNEICKIIRKDSVEEFISYINNNPISIDSSVIPSIYETNNFLLQDNVHFVFMHEKLRMTLFQYAIFCRSNQILNYLVKDIKILGHLDWICAAYGNNIEIINVLGKNKITPSNVFVEILYPDKNWYKPVFYDAVKCHHNSFADYILNTYLQNEEDVLDDLLLVAIKFYNFLYIQTNIMNDTSFYYLCKYDYYIIVEFLLKNKDIDLNKKINESEIETNNESLNENADKITFEEEI